MLTINKDLLAHLEHLEADVAVILPAELYTNANILAIEEQSNI